MTAINTTRTLRRMLNGTAYFDRAAPVSLGTVLGVDTYARALCLARFWIELPRLDFLVGSVSVGFSPSGFLRRFRLCSLAGL